jgi:hypothetical protein
MKRIIIFFKDSLHCLISNKKLNQVLKENIRLNLIILFLLFLGIIRVFLEYIWFGLIGETYDFTYHPITTSLGIIWYIYFLFIFVPLFLIFWLKILYNVNYSKKKIKKLYTASVYIWILYPFVALLNILFRSPVQIIDSKFFFFIPFNLTNSYFPWGMIIVIFILYYKFSYVTKKVYNVSFFKSFLAVFLSFFLIYLLAYHWLLHLYRFFLIRNYGKIILFLISSCFIIYFFKFYLPKIFNSDNTNS